MSKVFILTKKISLLLAVALVLFSSLSLNVYAMSPEQKNQLYRDYGLEYYSANSVACLEADSNLRGNDNAERVFNYLTSTAFVHLDDKAMNDVQAVSVMGNFQQESGMDPEVVNSIGATGLAQWLGGRLTKLGDYARSLSKPKTDLGVQLAFVNRELDGADPANDESAILKSPAFKGASKQKDIVAATVAFRKIYERPGAHEAADDKRIKAAVAFYDLYAGSASDSRSSAVRSACERSGARVGTGEMTIYKQCDPKWGSDPLAGGTVCSFGCGPTAMATIISTLTGKTVTPKDTVPIAISSGSVMPGGGGTSSHIFGPALAKAYGLRHEAYDFPGQSGDMRGKSGVEDYVNKVLDDGGLPLVVGTNAPAPFYKGFSHFVVIRARTPDGKWLVADSGRISNAVDEIEYDPDDIILWMRGYVRAFY